MEKIQKGDMKKKIQYLSIIGVVGIALILTSPLFINKNSKNPPAQKEEYNESLKEDDYETKVKMELEGILETIEGVGKVDVMVSIANESESEIAFNTTESQNVIQETDNQGGQRVTDQNNLSETAVMVNEGGGNAPFITRQNRPEIKGIMVVAEGAHDPAIKYRLDEAVQTALDLPSHKVVIYARKNK